MKYLFPHSGAIKTFVLYEDYCFIRDRHRGLRDAVDWEIECRETWQHKEDNSLSDIFYLWANELSNSCDAAKEEVGRQLSLWMPDV
jgi:hypothetical protein